MGTSIILFVMLGVFQSTLDSGMINVALPSIMRSLGITITQAELIISVYLVTITSTLLFWGGFADRLGKGRVYISGLGLFALGAVFCFISTNFQLLLVSRCVQALGASMMMSTGPAIIRETFAMKYLGRSLGIVGIATAFGLLAGPFVSGHILSSGGWRGVFLISASISTTVFLLGLLFMRQRLPGPATQSTGNFDVKGALLWPGIIIGVITIIKHLDTVMSVPVLVLLTGCIMLFILFISIEKKAPAPLLPIFLFTRNYYWTAVLCSAISFGVLFSVLVLVPFYLEYVLGASYSQIGSVMMAVPATLIVFSPGAGFLFDRIGARLLSSFGLFVSFCALMSIAFFSSTSSLPSVALCLALLGAGQSIFLSPNSASVLSRVENSFAARTSAVLATARNFGMALGAASAATLFSYLYGYYSGGMEFSSGYGYDLESFMLAFRMSFLLIGFVAFLGVVVSLFRD
jgi:MFS family permease